MSITNLTSFNIGDKIQFNGSIEIWTVKRIYKSCIEVFDQFGYSNIYNIEELNKWKYSKNK